MGCDRRGAEGRVGRRVWDPRTAMTVEHPRRRDAGPEAVSFNRAECDWVVSPVVTTIFASSAFGRLVGIDQGVLSGQPWFVVLPITSITAVEWLVHTPTPRPTASLEVRHLEGEYVSVVVSRVGGGPGHDHAVFQVSPIGRRASTAVITAIPISASVDVDVTARNEARPINVRGMPSAWRGTAGSRRRRGWIRRSNAGH
jgi:hypothetical protein